MIELPEHKTKIVCTIGPASSSEAVLEELFRNGMNVARLNFAHGSFEGHREVIERIRTVSAKLNRPCMILGDLPGPKIRIGELQKEPLLLEKGESVILTTKPASASKTDIPVSYERLTESVSAGSIIYLNDGFIQLKVEEISGSEVRCTVLIGGELLSHKGLNLPGAKIHVDTVTDHDLAFVKFGLEEGIDAFSVSFTEKAADIFKVRQFSEAMGKDIYIVAKIERAEALENIDEILKAADAIMIARGDLGVQIPLEDVPAVQKKLIHKANLMGKPVITATQMLVSMTKNIRPTRAEVSDVANAVLDGTDAVMLSEETAIGRYPAEAVKMLSRIVASAEIQKEEINALSNLADYFRKHVEGKDITIEDIISLNTVETANALNARYIVTPTLNGNIPRRISRFKTDRWILALTDNNKIRNFLSLSYGVFPILTEHISEGPDALRQVILNFDSSGKGDKIVLTGRIYPDRSDEIEAIRIINL